MLSNRFILGFFIGAILLAWIIPASWMTHNTVAALTPTSAWSGQASLDDVVWASGIPYVRVTIKDTASPLLLSNWSIENELGERAEIGLGTTFFSPHAIPTPLPITVASNTSLIIALASSPVGISFQEHLCSPYLRGTFPFEPPMEASCPDVTKNPQWQTLDNACRLLISSLPRCEVHSPEHLGDMTPTCSAFLRNIPTYASCVANTGEDARLPKWRIFLPGHDELIKKSGGTITLVDDHGLVVDTFSYHTISPE